MNPPTNFTNSDYPDLYVLADTTATKKQAHHLTIIRLNLILLLAGGICSLDIVRSCIGNELSLTLVAVSAITNVITIIVFAMQQFEKGWYGGRAIAESVKTLTWKYMMGAEPFDVDKNQSEVDDKFLAAVKALLAESRQLSFAFSSSDLAGTQISQKMRQVRALPWKQKLEIYDTQRIRDQQQWYMSKANWNQRHFKRWLGIILVSQVIVLSSAIIVLRTDKQVISDISIILISFSACVIAWMQTKRFQELSQSYAVTAQELGMNRSKLATVADEATFAGFVSDAETAMSREHTLWLARRSHF